jgi:hypothetical protein
MSKQAKSRSRLPRLPELPADSVESNPAKGASPAFGVEGTNKTRPEPVADAAPSEELEGVPGKHIPKSPYTAGSY